MSPVIDQHRSVDEEALVRRVSESVRANRLDPKLLYVTSRQSKLWRDVFLRHSPIHGNAEFSRIYSDAFARTAGQVGLSKVELVGLGCGTGLKEAGLCAELQAKGIEVDFCAVDVSRDLVLESVRRLIAAGAEHRRSLVCDLAEVDFLEGWLSPGNGPRLVTFFGLIPNLKTDTVTKLFRAVLRPGDVLLASAHLAPMSNDGDLGAAMLRVAPQYDNAETLAWLQAGLEDLGISERVERPVMSIGTIDGVPAFIATARWKNGTHAEPLQLFHSLRYTPELFEETMRGAGFAVERLALTSCEEEGIWSIARAAA